MAKFLKNALAREEAGKLKQGARALLQKSEALEALSFFPESAELIDALRAMAKSQHPHPISLDIILKLDDTIQQSLDVIWHYYDAHPEGRPPNIQKRYDASPPTERDVRELMSALAEAKTGKPKNRCGPSVVETLYEMERRRNAAGSAEFLAALAIHEGLVELTHEHPSPSPDAVQYIRSLCLFGKAYPAGICTLGATALIKSLEQAKEAETPRAVDPRVLELAEKTAERYAASRRQNRPPISLCDAEKIRKTLVELRSVGLVSDAPVKDVQAVSSPLLM